MGRNSRRPGRTWYCQGPRPLALAPRAQCASFSAPQTRPNPQVDVPGRAVTQSKIFKWYFPDFGANKVRAQRKRAGPAKNPIAVRSRACCSVSCSAAPAHSKPKHIPLYPHPPTLPQAERLRWLLPYLPPPKRSALEGLLAADPGAGRISVKHREYDWSLNGDE